MDDQHGTGEHIDTGASAGKAEEDQDGAFQPDHVLATEPPNSLAELGAGDRRDLVSHETAGLAQPVDVVGLDTQPDQRCLSWISRKGAHRHRLGRVEPVVLKDHHGPRLADVAAAGRRSPNLAAPHPSSWLRASMKAWSSAA